MAQRVAELQAAHANPHAAPSEQARAAQTARAARQPRSSQARNIACHEASYIAKLAKPITLDSSLYSPAAFPPTLNQSWKALPWSSSMRAPLPPCSPAMLSLQARQHGARQAWGEPGRGPDPVPAAQTIGAVRPKHPTELCDANRARPPSDHPPQHRVQPCPCSQPSSPGRA